MNNQEPWKDELDAYDFNDELTGLPCAIRRVPSSGGLCGYIGIPDDHPWYGKFYYEPVQSPDDFWTRPCDIDKIGVMNIFTSALKTNEQENMASISLIVRCHGGITFSGKPWWAPEHRASWWIGFDCAHSGDLSPNYMDFGFGGIYRDVDYVKKCLAEACQDIMPKKVLIKHTPGPWLWDREWKGEEWYDSTVGKLRSASTGEDILDFGWDGEESIYCKKRADMMLIASAPELLDFVKAILLNQKHLGDEHFLGVQQRLMEMGRKALNKAEGEI